jgi:putative membrane protein
MKSAYVDARRFPPNGCRRGAEGVKQMMFIGGFFWLLILAGIVVLLVWLFSGKPFSSIRRGGTTEETPLEILKKRYARGEISPEDYERMKRELS